MPSEEITCRELVELVTEYLEYKLAWRDRRRFEQHLRKCPYCTAYLEQIRQTITVLGRLPEESLPPEIREQLLAAFRGWKAA
jgi:anti-sigma factor RsiW